MAKKLMSWKTKGMNQDLSVSAFNPEFSFENMNMRLSTNEGNTTLSWVNERGTEEILTGGSDNTVFIKGIPIGTAVINHKLILFTCGNTTSPETDTSSVCYPDHIYSIIADNHREVSFYQIYGGNLNLSSRYPLETLVSYESDSIQKVYWVDGLNQPRLINVKDGVTRISSQGINIDTQFDFSPQLTLPSTATVEKHLTGGMFAPGVIQYCFTYNYKYGQQSNIVWVSPLNYIAPKDRGASPEEKVSNSFTIKITSPDIQYDFIRLYSVQRTSINSTPIVKRLVDLDFPTGDNSNFDVQFIDDGTVGDLIDPQELLYIGGKEIIAGTMADKDSTLFLGNITQVGVTKPNASAVTGVTFSKKTIPKRSAEGTTYSYDSLLNKNADDITTFKGGEWYRFGYQLQRKTGEWTEPIHIEDKQNTIYPIDTINSLQVAKATMAIDLANVLGDKKSDYISIRPLVVFPDSTDRTVICQGVLNPTVFNAKDRMTDAGCSQASWFFRPFTEKRDVLNAPTEKEVYSQIINEVLEYEHYTSLAAQETTASSIISDGGDAIGPSTKHLFKECMLEVQGAYNDVGNIRTAPKAFESNTQFFVDQNIVTLNSPDLEFDTEAQSTLMEGVKLRIVGAIPISAYESYHSITASSRLPLAVDTIPDDNDNNSTTINTFRAVAPGEMPNNVIHTVENNKTFGGRFVSNVLWDDASVDRSTEGYQTSQYSYKYVVYPWQRQGSLNNDPGSEDVASARLKTKKFSHTLYSAYSQYLSTRKDAQGDGMLPLTSINVGIHLQENDYLYRIKVGGYNYYPNIDKLLYNNNGYWLYHWTKDLNQCIRPNSDKVNSIIQMKYKSSTHAAISLGTQILPYGFPYNDSTDDRAIGKSSMTGRPFSPAYWGKNVPAFGQAGIALPADWFTGNEGPTWLWLGELYKEVDENTIFGGNSPEALRANNWMIGGKAVPIGVADTVNLEWTNGDTYYQRYDCLKTYAFTPEDINQNVEILSFMCETRVNIDGRYDKNRGLSDNTNVSPTNFNILNPVYSQKNNYFSYKMLDHDANKNNRYPNWITYTQTKQSGADMDEWTHVTLGGVLEMDGDKGEVTSLQRFNNQIIAFQDKGIAQVLYNESASIATTEGVPIELANSGKVQGKRYFSDTVGCSNKWSICQTPAGLYFMDSNARSIFRFNGQLDNLALSKGFNAWCKKNITSDVWKPYPFSSFVTYYDQQNQDVLFINWNNALAYSEKLDVFTSFYSYGSAPYFCNLDSIGLWINQSTVNGNLSDDYKLFYHQRGDYCKFFGTTQPYWLTLVGNPEPQTDKIFTNMEFRACVDEEGQTTSTVVDGETVERYTPYIPFNFIETWNEYQHGVATLSMKHGRDMFKHFMGTDFPLARKFRIWRCDIPRDNFRWTDPFDYTFDHTFHISGAPKRLDRMRNPWLYIKLRKNAEKDELGQELPMHRTEVHDLVMTYYN